MSDQERNDNLSEVIDQRVQVYGNPVETFARIAEVWSGILGVPVNATDVPLCLIGMKLIRTTQAPDYSDNSDDVEGYLDIFRQLVGEDMIHARSVTEYIEKKWPAKPNPFDAIMAPYEYGPAQANADQSKFYAEHDRTKDAGPDEDEPKIKVCREHGYPYEMCKLPHTFDPRWQASDESPIPYQLVDTEVLRRLQNRNNQ